MTKKNIWIIGILVIAIGIVGVGMCCTSTISVSAEKLSNIDNLAKQVEIQKDEIKLNDELGSNTPYPQIYTTAENLVEFKGYDKTKAVTEAANRYVEKKH